MKKVILKPDLKNVIFYDRTISGKNRLTFALVGMRFFVPCGRSE